MPKQNTVWQEQQSDAKYEPMYTRFEQPIMLAKLIKYINLTARYGFTWIAVPPRLANLRTSLNQGDKSSLILPYSDTVILFSIATDK